MEGLEGGPVSLHFPPSEARLGGMAEEERIREPPDLEVFKGQVEIHVLWLFPYNFAPTYSDTEACGDCGRNRASIIEAK